MVCSLGSKKREALLHVYLASLDVWMQNQVLTIVFDNVADIYL